MEYNRILRHLLFVLFICAISQKAFSHNETFTNKAGISQDSIPKSEIAEYRKTFESVEKMIASKRGNYADAKRSFDALSGSRVRRLPEFSSRYSTMQSKLNAWNLEVNPKQPPVVVPNNPSNPPKNTGKTNEKMAASEEPKINETGRKSLMLSYFPDTMTVGTDFLAYIEITKDNTMQFGRLSSNGNSALDSIIISSSAINSAVVNTQVSAELSRDGGADNFTINPRSDKTKTIGESGSSRWEWLVHANAEGESRLRLTVTYQKQNKDGSMQETSAINKVIVVKGLAKKNDNASSGYLLWIILGLIILAAVVILIISLGRKNRNRYRDDRYNDDRDNRDDRLKDDRIIKP